MVGLRITTVRFQQESLSALNRPGCPFSARILVLFQQELMSALLRKCCPLSARTGVRFEQDFAIDALPTNVSNNPAFLTFLKNGETIAFN